MTMTWKKRSQTTREKRIERWGLVCVCVLCCVVMLLPQAAQRGGLREVKKNTSKEHNYGNSFRMFSEFYRLVYFVLFVVLYLPTIV